MTWRFPGGTSRASGAPASSPAARRPGARRSPSGSGRAAKRRRRSCPSTLPGEVTRVLCPDVTEGACSVWRASAVARPRTASRSPGEDDLPVAALSVGATTGCRRARPASPACRRPARRCRSRRRATSAPERAARSAGHRLRGLGGDGPVALEHLRRHAEAPHLHLVRVGDDAAEEDVARARRRPSAGRRRCPPVQDSAVASVRPELPAARRGRCSPTVRSSSAKSSSAKRARERPHRAVRRASSAAGLAENMSTRISRSCAQTVTSSPSPSPPASSSARATADSLGPKKRRIRCVGGATRPRARDAAPPTRGRAARAGAARWAARAGRPPRLPSCSRRTAGAVPGEPERHAALPASRPACGRRRRSRRTGAPRRSATARETALDLARRAPRRRPARGRRPARASPRCDRRGSGPRPPEKTADVGLQASAHRLPRARPGRRRPRASARLETDRGQLAGEERRRWRRPCRRARARCP